MGKFKKAETSKVSGKPDNRGNIRILIQCLDPKSGIGAALSNNRKEEIVVEDSTVGTVYTELNALLFSPDIVDEEGQ